MIQSGLKITVEKINYLHQILTRSGSDYQRDFFIGLEFFFYFNIVLLITGLLGFVGLSLTNN